MANIIGNNNMNIAANTNASSNNPYMHNQQIVGTQQLPNVVVTPNTNPGSRLSDVCNFLQPANMLQYNLSTGACPYDHIIEMIRGLDLQDDGIVMNHKIKAIEMDFCNIVRDENMLCESMEYINDKALSDGDTSLKFALLFSSRNFDALAMNETKVRSAMLKILETNFLNAGTYRLHNKDRFYNSITLLGEYYHRVRLADNSPITILGESLLGLLIREVSEVEVFDIKLAKLILSQITLNGDAMRVKHKPELTQLLYHIRRNLIEQPSLKPAVKALLLMTLDLYYSNFVNLGAQLEEMYTKYLVQDDEDEGNNNLLQEQIMQQHQLQPQQQQLTYQQHLQQPIIHAIQPITTMQITQTVQPIPQQSNQTVPLKEQEPNYEEVSHENTYANANGNVSAGDDSFEKPAKKWSEQVCEESFYENEFGCELNDNDYGIGGGDGDNQGGQKTINTEKREQSTYERDSSSINSRRSYTNQQRKSPRPLKNNTKSNSNDDQHQQQTGEEQDESKPLPRWRAPRFNRDHSDQPNDRMGGNHRNQQRRFSASFEEDRQSIRSDGGSIRLYSINDRLKHSQEKIERSNGSQYNSLANSNWDRQSQRDDRSERSYISNYERGHNNNRRGGRNYNSRQTYDKPPRFQKNQHPRQLNNKDNGNNRSDTWRRSNNNMSNSYHDENSSYPSNGPESNSRSSSRARTLPRPSKSNIDGGETSYRRTSQSPTHGNHYNRGSSGGASSHNRSGRSYNARYSSQSSLASEASTNTLDRRHHRQNRNFEKRSQQKQQQLPQKQDWEDTHSLHGQPEESSWDSKDNNSELVRNARNTTKYMNYLSSKK